MRIVKFDCIDMNQNFHVVRLETPFPHDEVKQKRWFEQVSKAYRDAGIEVLSFSRVEEITVDIAPTSAMPKYGVGPVRNSSRLRARLTSWLGAATGFAALCMSVIGFDDGFSVVSFIKHLHMVAHF
ncbi:hypothetical protein [Burkholderia cepacia]|uniref:hypothetical protein n=1 Tax=Burkholderia cepacia TaxID=292 RepID=UPI0012D9BD6D|nr:hypothetical protein [Burkholderia cepacia]